MSNSAEFKINEHDKQVIVTKKFNASQQLVWTAFTSKELIERWWAPKPYQCVIKTFDFNEGGHIHYYMLGPQGDKHWCIAKYLTINMLNNYTINDAFCNENKIINSELPSTH